MNWQPTASIEYLRKKAAILSKVRQFFLDRHVLEVDTPALSAATVTDEHLHSFETLYVGPGYAQGKTLYLQTSPEYAMKRLLCAGSGSIYQICKSFRNEEAGRFHNPEFTMLEWYRIDFDHFALMDEIQCLIELVLDCQPASRISYQQVFLKHLKVDPLTVSLADLKTLCSKHCLGDIAENETNKDTLLQLLFCHCIEPIIGQSSPCFVYDFPASQAALARLSVEDKRVAERFELYYKGIELANGFHELSNAKEQRKRFELDNQKRINAGRPAKLPDENLLDALASGLPDCAGVAMGIDRLIMLALNAEHIEQVIAFPVERA